MKQHNVTINFKVKTIIFDSDYCLKHYIHNYQLITIYNKKLKFFKQKTKIKIENKNITTINAIIFIKIVI